MAHQLKAAAPTRRRKLALWNKDNKEQWGIVKLIPKYADVLRKNCPDLCEIIQHEDLWRFLKKYGVTDRVIEDRIKAHDTSEDVVYHLLHHIECGPAWRLHALLRACCKRHQEHVVTLLGLDPDDYSGPSPPVSDNEESSPPLTDMCFHCPTSVVQVTSETTTLSPSPPGQQSRTLSSCQQDVCLQHPTSEVQGTPIQVQASRASFGLMRPEVLPPLQHVGKDKPAVQGSLSLPSSGKLTHDPSLAVRDVSTDAPTEEGQNIAHHRASPRPSTQQIRGSTTTSQHVINLPSGSTGEKKSDDDTSSLIPSPSTATDLLHSLPQERSSHRTTSSHLHDVPKQKTLSEEQVSPDNKTASFKSAQVITCGPSFCQEDGGQQTPDRSTASSASQTSDSSSHSAQALDRQGPSSKTETVFSFSSPASVNVSPGPQDVAFKKQTPECPPENVQAPSPSFITPQDSLPLQKGQELMGPQQPDTLTSSQPSDNQIDTEQNTSGTPQIRDTLTAVAAPVAEGTSEDKEHLKTILRRLRESTTTNLDEILELVSDKDLQSTDVLTTIESVYINNKTGVKGVPTEEQERFYQFCLQALLGSIKEFTEEHLKKFNLLGSVYLSFLNKQSKTDKYKKEVTFYYLGNKTLCDFFACRALETLPDGMRKAILLKISSRDSFRYLQKLIFQLLGKSSSEISIPLLVGMTHLLLVQQTLNKNPQKKLTSNKEWSTFMSTLQTLLQRIERDVPAPGVLLLEPDSKHALYNDTGAELWEMVASTFHLLTVLTTRNTSPYGEDYWVKKYFHLSWDGQIYSFVPKVFLNLLTECSPDVQAAVARDTYHRLLPCNGVYPCGNIRWMTVSSDAIECPSPGVVDEGLLQHRRLVSHRETVDRFEIRFTYTAPKWRHTPDDHWSCTAWGTALQAVVSHYTVTSRLVVSLPERDSAMKGLLYSITPIERSDFPGNTIYIYHGTISLLELQQWYHESGTTHNMDITLLYPTLQLPADELTRDQLLQWLGDELHQDVKHHIANKGQTLVRFKGPYQRVITLIDPIITFM